MTPEHEPPRGAARTITSLQNDRVKLIRSLDMRKARRETGLFVAEGASVLIAGRDAGWEPKMFVFLAGSATTGVHRELLDWAQAAGAECLEVSEAVLGKIAAKENPQTVLGVFAQRRHRAPVFESIPADGLWVALEEVRDPGNLGTIVRTADAVGAGGVMLIGNCVDAYARETVRATMGSIFNVPLVRMTLEECLPWLSRWAGDVAGTHLGAAEDFRARAYRTPTLLLMGGEGPGLSAELSAACTRLVKIPMAGRLDSLNLAVATGLMLYEIAKGRLKL
jgi:RNA methyltransferase, TrmH family